MTPPLEEDRSRHAVCKLKTALRLIAGRDVYVPTRAYPAFQPSRFARALQMGNSLLNLPLSVAPKSVFVSGRTLAYLSGNIEYFTDHVGRRAVQSLARKQPFFVVSSDPGVSIASFLGCDTIPAPKLHLSSQCVVVVTAHYRGAPAVFHVGSCEESRAEILRQAAGLGLAAMVPGLQGLVPELTKQYRSGVDLEISIETEVRGAPMPFRWQRIDAVLELWPSGSGAGPTTGLARPCLPEELAKLCDRLPGHHDSLRPLAESLLKWHSALRMPGEITHGDLWLGNVLFAGDAITGLVDWEWARDDGLRVVDALQLLFMSYSVFRDTSISESLRQFWTNSIEDRELNDRLAELCRRFGISENDLKFAALLLWFDHLRERTIRGRMPSRSWTEDMLSRTIPVIHGWLSGQKRGTREATA